MKHPWAILLLALVPSARAAPPAAAGTGYDLVFADEFNGVALDTMKGWIDAYPWGRTHNHEAYMASGNVILGDGTLTLRAERVAQGGKPFTSGAVSTGYSNFRVNGGYLEARILLPTTPGSWPAFWGLDDGWPPEADIMEFPLTTDGGANGYPNTDYHTAFHYRNASGDPAAGAGRVNPSGIGALNAAYHTFGMHWVEDASVTFYFDGVQVSSFVSSEVAEMTGMYLILNYAVGGWPGTPSTAQWPAGFADETKVDWVRVWQQRPGGSSTTSTWKVNGGGSWDTSANWTGIVPRHSGQQAVFGSVGSAAGATVDWSYSRTLGGVTFAGGTASTAYTIGGGNESLQLAGDNGTANAYVEVLAASRTNQAIAARMELYNTTQFRNNMTNGMRLVLNGVITGDGDLVVNGPGVVQFSNNNTYTGDTSIGVGQGPAVARVTRSRPFGSNGTVTIGPGGNATTAGIEIQDNREVPNPIVFSGRHNESVGIRNLGGSNTFSGTIGAQTGGGQYLIQSDAGLLTLSGAASGAGGVALSAIATGSRTFTLQGDGNGVVSGSIQNGNGAVSLAKDGSGTWTIGRSNTFSGSVTVNAGTLYANPGNAPSNRAFSYVSGITVNSGATLRCGSNGLFGWNGTQERPVTVNAGGTLTCDAGSDVGVSTLTLAGGTLASRGAATTWGTWRFDEAGDRLLVTEDSTVSALNVKFENPAAHISVSSGKTLTVSGTITDATSGGPSYLTVSNGTGAVVLNGANAYRGATRVANGTLLVNGWTGTGAVTVASGTLGGTGRIGGAVTVQSGGTLAPGASLGTLTASNGVTLQAGSTTRVEIAAGGPSNDLLRCTGPLVCGGTLIVTNLGGTLTAGNQFTVMTASAVSGTFAATNLPPLSPTSLAWRVQYGPAAVVLAVTNLVAGFDAYVLQIANPAQRGAADDPDGDGYANLLEYATGGNPALADPVARLTGWQTNGWAHAAFNRNTNAADATLTVQGAYAVTNGAPWQAIAVNSNGVWSGAAAVSETGGANPAPVTVRDMAPGATNRFLRLRITRP